MDKAEQQIETKSQLLKEIDNITYHLVEKKQVILRVDKQGNVKASIARKNKPIN